MKKIKTLLLVLLPISLIATGCSEFIKDNGLNLTIANKHLENEEKVIVCDAIPEKVGLYSNLKISSCYGSYNGVKFSVLANITTPSGLTVETAKDYYVDEDGTYSIELTSNIDNELISKTLIVKTDGYSSECLFSYTNSSFVRENENVSYASNACSDKGLTISFDNASSTVSYKNIVDLRKVNGNIIEIVPNVNEDTIILDEFRVTLTDAYDPNIKVSAYIFSNDSYKIIAQSDWDSSIICSMIQAEWNGNQYGIPTYSGLPYQTVAWHQSFYPQNGDRGYMPLQFGFDPLTNVMTTCLYTTTANNSFVVCDLDNPDDEYSDFEGFTTGEVYVSIEAIKSTGTITVLKVGNDIISDVDASYFEKNTGNALFKGYNFANMLTGVVGFVYPLPDISACNSETFISIYYKPESSTLEPARGFDGYTFIPEVSGHYHLYLNSENAFGYFASFSGEFDIIDTAPEYIDKSDISSINIKLFEVNSVPAFKYSGGVGKLTVKIELVEGSETKIVNTGDHYSIKDKGARCYFKVTVTDQILNSKVFNYKINVDNNVVVFNFIDSFDEVAVTSGNYFTVPDYTAIDYSLDDVSKNNFNVLIKRGKTKTYNPGESFKVENDTTLQYTRYPSGEVLKTLKIHCTPNTVDLSDEYSIAKQYGSIENVSNIESCEIGTHFQLKGDTVIEHPYVISTSSLYVSFAYFPSVDQYTSVDVVFKSLDNHDLTFTIYDFDITPKAPKMLVNGKEVKTKPSVEELRYESNDVSDFSGQMYYMYTLLLDGGTGEYMNGKSVLLGKVDSWSDGDTFNNFKNGAGKVSFKVNGAANGNNFVINRLSNQYFTSTALKFGDLVSPSVGFDGRMKSTIVTLNSTLHIPNAFAYDVFDSAASITMSIVDSDGNYILREVAPVEYLLRFEKYGTYGVIYDIYDSHGNSSSIRYIYQVSDNEAPVISIKGNYEESYKGSVKILSATVNDNYDENPILLIYVKSPDGIMIPVNAGDKVQLTSKGKYHIVYVAYDKNGNTARKDIVVVSK